MSSTPEPMRTAFYGGSFNPPHIAHVMAVTYLLSVGGFERVLVVVVYQHAFDKPLLDFEHRLRMCELAMGWLPDVEVSPMESSLPTPTRTVETLRYLKKHGPEYRLHLVVGADQLQEAESWHGFDEIVRLAPPFVLGRVGAEHPSAPPPVLPDVSSTRVRSLLARRGDPDADRELERLVPSAVLRYIDEHGLYR